MKRAFSKKNLWENLPPPIKGSVGKIAGLVPPQILLGGKYREWESLVTDSDRWSQEKTEQYQLEQLKSIFMLAQEKSLYYQKSFADAGFDPKTLSSFEDLEKLPLIDKHVINGNADDLMTVPKNTPGLDYVSTGGSSGEPLRFLIGSDRSAVEFAHLAVSWFRVGYKLTTPQAVLRGAVLEQSSKGIPHFYDPLLRRHNYSNFHMNDDAMGTYMDHISKIGSCYLNTYPSSLNILVRYLNRAGRKPPKNIKGLLIGSENIYEEDRQAAEVLFGVRFFSWYGHSEKLVMAAECEKSTAYHVFPTYGYCELVDEAGKRVTTPGARGEIVGTGFINRAMPFIRYRTGDYATYVGEHCEKCGRAHLLIEDISGHNTLEMLVARDNSLIPWAACNVHGDTFEGVLQFQFKQTQAGQATLKVVPAGLVADINIPKIQQDLSAKLNGKLDFDVEVVDKIELTARGKSVFVDQQIDTDKIMIEG